MGGYFGREDDAGGGSGVGEWYPLDHARCLSDGQRSAFSRVGKGSKVRQIGAPVAGLLVVTGAFMAANGA